jgi:hypothetical protein
MTNKRFLIVLILLAATASPTALASIVCSPLDNSARVLASPSPNDIHPDWTGESYLGTSWSFIPSGSAQDGTGTYLKGNLYSSRGGLVNAEVYVLAKEWMCSADD